MTSRRPVLIQNKKMMGWGVAATFGRAMVLPLVKQTIMNSEVTIIGIAGGTGSGKTTVVKKIVEALPPHYVAVVPLDSYYNENKGMSDEERHAINFDHPDAFDWKLLINKKLRDMMDLKIFVDADPDERLIRNIQRDTIDRGRTVSMVVDRYLSVLKPMHEQFIEPTKRFADIIIPQGGENAKGIGIICDYIQGIVER